MTKNAKGKQGHNRKPRVPKDLVKYTDEEKARIAKYFERAKREPAKIKSAEDDPVYVTLAMAKMTEALGTPDNDLQDYLLVQVIQTFKGCVSSKGFDYSKMAKFINNAMALLNGIQPRDEIEGMLAVQMIAVHNMVMETMKLAMITGQPPQWIESNVNHATKMLRTFVTQMEALKRYRTGGQQKVTVEHVHVTAGGQAIVGVVNRGEGNSDKRG